MAGVLLQQGRAAAGSATEGDGSWGGGDTRSQSQGFYRASALQTHAERNTVVDFLSVRLSVRSSHADIVLKP